MTAAPRSELDQSQHLLLVFSENSASFSGEGQPELEVPGSVE